MELPSWYFIMGKFAGMTLALGQMISFLLIITVILIYQLRNKKLVCPAWLATAIAIFGQFWLIVLIGWLWTEAAEDHPKPFRKYYYGFFDIGGSLIDSLLLSMINLILLGALAYLALYAWPFYLIYVFIFLILRQKNTTKG